MEQIKQVLIVDDDDVVRQLVKMVVGRRGIKAELAASGDDVNRLFAAGLMQQFSLFFLDLILPDITGWEIIARLKDDPATANVPIVVLTGALLSDTEKERILEKANAILEKKHFTMAAFEKLLDQWF